MNHFVTVFRKVVSLKVSVALFTLGILGIVSGSQFFLSSPSAFAATNCQYYTVKSGDTLSGIGATYHTSYQAIAQVNNISNVNLIFPGERFCIPANGSVYTSGQATQQAPAVTNLTPASQPATAPAPVAPSSSVTGMIEQIFGANAPEAINIARCESGLNPGAYNPTSIGGSHAAGVFQILYPSTWAGTPEAGASPYNAWANIEAAHAIFVRDGYSWREWTC
ncbi:MAG TPA: LysM peptidoglycan-binding domain-containing protein [Ktedonobacteraceae bacterium]|nr:LysM peptidoglycan-binding domain-containing protein [Ktedonobacteraceae bacterium]